MYITQVGFVDITNISENCIKTVHCYQQDGSPQQTWSLSLPSTPVEKQQNHLTQMQNPL